MENPIWLHDPTEGEILNKPPTVYGERNEDD